MCRFAAVPPAVNQPPTLALPCVLLGGGGAPSDGRVMPSQVMVTDADSEPTCAVIVCVPGAAASAFAVATPAACVHASASRTSPTPELDHVVGALTIALPLASVAVSVSWSAWPITEIGVCAVRLSCAGAVAAGRVAEAGYAADHRPWTVSL